MLAVIRMPHTKIKLEVDGEQELVEVIKKHWKIIGIDRQENDSIPIEESFVYKERSSNRVGGRIKAMRRRAKVTQKELAAKTGIRQSHISEIERGKRQIKTVKIAKKIAKAFDVDYRLLI